MTAAPEAIMLFAAGFGTRMGVLTQDRPKPLLPVAGVPLIDHAMQLITQPAITTRVINLHYKGEMLEDYLQAQPIAFSREYPDILDTGGGLKAALPLLGSDPVVTMNTDAIWSGPNPIDILLAEWDPARMDALLICVPIENTVGRLGGGDFALTESKEVRRGDAYVYGGVQILKCAKVRAHPDTVFSLNEIWDDMAGEGRLFGAVYPGKWCDVGHPEGLKLAETLLSEPHV
ncbi:MAG: nucleotidyltransferase family protein [Arenibacterium sp.]